MKYLSILIAMLFVLAPIAKAGEEKVLAAPKAEAELKEGDSGTITVTDKEGEKKTVKTPPFLEKVKQGGIIVVVLLFISVALVSLSLERLIRLNRDKVIPAGLADKARELWKDGKYAEISQICNDQRSTLSRIISSFARHRTCTSGELSTMAGDIASQDMRAEIQKLTPFALIATISPLLGLLGTVSGMIESFEVVAVAGSLGDASLLADGIAKALITTAAGLLVAVPAIAMYNFFKIKTNRLALQLEYEVNALIGEWFLSDHIKAAEAESAKTTEEEKA